MITLLIEFSVTTETALRLCEKESVLLVDPSLVESKEEIKLAEFLSERNFRKEKNLAKKKKYEFLLWLTGKRDIKSAMDYSRPKSNQALAVFFGKDRKKNLLSLLKVTKKRKPTLINRGNPLQLERIALSRIMKIGAAPL